jgi:hypothetical protein
MAVGRMNLTASDGNLVGFDCAAPLTHTVIDSVTVVLGRKPQVVGRYVDGPYAATRAEIALAHARGLAVWLISATATSTEVMGDSTAGRMAGLMAARAASGLLAPAGTLVALDIEAGWSPSADWVAWWVYGLMSAGYRPAVYGSPSDAGFASAVAEARERYAAVARRLILWAASWGDAASGGWPRGVPGLPPSGWQYAGNRELSSGVTIDLDMWRADTPGLWMPDTRPAATPALPLTVHGNSSSTLDRFTFPLTLTGTKPYSLWILHDTGAFELLLDGATAKACGAPNLGATEVAGVTGSSEAYWSEVDVTIAGRTWRRVSCVVDPGATESLWGYRFYQDHGYGLQIDPVRQTLTIWDARTSAKP